MKENFKKIYEKFYLKPRQNGYDISFLQKEFKQKYDSGMFREVENVAIELIRKCNLNCEMCSISEAKFLNQKLDNMSFEDYKFVLSQIPNNVSITPNGLGEAFLRDDIIDILKYTKQKGHKVSINSNGMKFKLEALKYLDEIIFSIDSMDKDELEDIRKGVKYEKLIDIILQSIEYKKKNNLDVKISINGVILSQSIHSIKKLFDFAQDLNLSLSMSPASNVFKTDTPKYYEFQKKLKELNQDNVDWSEIVKLYIDNYNFELTIYYPNKRKGWCFFGFGQFYVDNNLNLSICCVKPRNTIIGNLKEKSFKELLKSEYLQKYRDSQLNLTPFEVCDRCCIGYCDE